MKPFPAVIVSLLLSGMLFGDVFDDLKIPRGKVEAIRDLADRLVRAGYPDGKEAELYLGKISIFSILDPKNEKAPFPLRSSFMQSTVPDGKQMEYGFQFNGTHLKMKNGTWFLEIYHSFQPGKQTRVNHEDAARVYPETIFTEALQKYPFDLAEKAPKYVEGYLATQKDFLCSVMNKAIPLSFYLQLNPEETPPALLLLHRAGMAEAPLLAYVIADQRSRKYGMLYYWNSTPGPFDPTGRYPGLHKTVSQWEEDHQNGYEFEEIDVAFRRSLHRFFRNMILERNSPIPAEKAAELAKLCVDPGDPQGISSKIDHLLDAATLPEELPEHAPLADKLRVWGLPKKPEMVVKQGGGEGNTTSLITMFASPPEAYTPVRSDLDGLFGLLSDTRPSRFFDYQGSRTVGENALRALAVLFKMNPLKLIEMDGLEPWTPERSALAAKKLQIWWRDHQHEIDNFILADED